MSHKVSVLGRVIDKYRAYLNHLLTTSEDRTVKAVDREKLKGCCQQRSDCNKFIEATFCFVQENEVCVVRAAEALFNVNKNIENQKYTAFEDLHTVKEVLDRLKMTRLFTKK